ncbi:Nucleic acid-binding, OB-fold [Sesbania bispinosa]|nr:Nucleic acid-binding, OB-fold [Sesbania bispinosa]
MAGVHGPFDSIKDIKEGMQALRLKVRVVRVWEVCQRDNPSNVFSLEIVLVDAEGERIQASIRKAMIRKFRDSIVEGVVYKMVYFSILESNVSEYRASFHPFKLLFQPRTRIIRTESEVIPRFGIQAKTSEELRETNGESDYMFDFIGLLTAVGEEKEFTKFGRPIRVLEIELGTSEYSRHVTGNGNGNVHVIVINSVERLYYLRPPAPGSYNEQRSFSWPREDSSEKKITCEKLVSSTSSALSTGDEDKLFKNRGLSSPPSTASRPRKRAVLCGVTYRQRRFSLKGTINDVTNMKSLLLNKFNFQMESIRVLTEEEINPNLIPTKRNIMESLKWLVNGCQAGDSLVFYFSGHGMQQPAEYDKGDEIDDLDETICPVDFIKEGMITDNEMNSTIVRPLKNGVTLHAIFDAGHSATTLDLMHVYTKVNGKWKWVDNKPPSKEPIVKDTSGGLVICLSACEDSQMAAETAAFGGKEMSGLMTYLLTKTIREHSGITYAHLLEKIHYEIGKINQSKYHSRFLNRIFHSKVEQHERKASSLHDDDGNAADTSASAASLTCSFIRAMQDEPNFFFIA